MTENEELSTDSGEPQEVVDNEYLRKAKERLVEIGRDMAELQESTDPSDQVALRELEEEKAKIIKHLSTALKPSGQSRSFRDEPENAKKAVSNAISRALDDIKICNEPLDLHLHNSLQRGR